ncbi:TIGR04255 family protein [Fibrobacter succinogenes]|uniref:TIGR04255 family protein n=1 Tax=Fibrobacter succinogenes TaxID=833 RepID=A0A380S5J3_FIBSU|nr:TIGR04255 family protein [Fibrobacter succinogenes]PWJ35834.1 uncharacterized protein (TIGR04255 family) [Fibrobacter succinogenes subsp. elongatus]SUQ24489.1 TIGR04255 family protein [Fibrobacter succinogenes]
MKDQYTRENIRSTMLKLVVIRLDISGITNFDGVIEHLKKASFMNEAFKRMRYLTRPRNPSPSKEYFSQNGTLPLSKNIQSEKYHFFECSLEESSKAFLDITPESICLTVQCDGAYNGSRKYTDFMIEVVECFNDIDHFISLDRIGIRKIDSVDIDDLNKFSEFFDKDFIVKNDFVDSHNIRESTKTSIYFENEIYYNVVQYMAKKTNDSYHIVFDVDAHLDDADAVEHYVMNSSQLRELMYIEMQNKMFDFFKNIVTEEYLESCKIKG